MGLLTFIRNEGMSFCYTDFPRMPFKKDFDDNIALTNITVTKGNGEFCYNCLLKHLP